MQGLNAKKNLSSLSKGEIVLLREAYILTCNIIQLAWHKKSNYAYIAPGNTIRPIGSTANDILLLSKYNLQGIASYSAWVV